MIQSVKRLINAFKYVEDANNAISESYEKGREEANEKFQGQIKAYNDRIAELTQETVRLDERLRRIHEERLDNIEDRWTRKCKLCKVHTEEERKRLRAMQNVISTYISDFTEVFNMLYKHAVFVENEHDTILKSAARVQNSRASLESIRKEANVIINKIEPLLQLTEEDIAHVKEGIIQPLLSDKSRSEAPNGGNSERHREVPGESGRSGRGSKVRGSA